MKKVSLSLLFLLAVSGWLVIWADSATPNPLRMRQPDGSTITLRLHGDEFCSWYTSEDGRTVYRKGPDGWWRPDNGSRPNRVMIAEAKARRQARDAALAPARQEGLGFGEKHFLVILVQWSDQRFRAGADDYFTRALNQSGFSDNGSVGSARDYYMDASQGQFTPVFDVYGPVTLSRKHTDFPSGDGEKHYDMARTMIKEAAALLDAEVDFSAYDLNDDGNVDSIYLLFPGYAQSNGGGEDTIWPHKSSISGSVIHDGVYLKTYACSSELRGKSGTDRSGIGTFCHEFGHVLGFPDLYPTVNNAKHKTLDTWDIMDYGAYNNNGHTPPAYSAYERFFFGWTKPLILNTPNHYYIKDIQTTNACGIITQDGTSNLDGSQPQPNVFYLVENRQNNGWDTYLPGHGLMITKIQYNPDNWYNNTVNNSPDNMGIDIIEAAPATGIKAQASDLYPAGNNRCVPYTFYPLLNIEEDSQGIITFQFMNGGDDAPVEITDQQTTGIDNIPSHDNDSEIVAIHTITGQNTGIKDITRLTQGIYIITTKNKNANSTLQTKKIYVKKI